MTNKPSKKEKTIEKIVQLICVAITIAGCLLFSSCSMEDVCGTVTGDDVDCNEYGCIYYLYIDDKKVSVNEDIYNTTYRGDEVCIGY